MFQRLRRQAQLQIASQGEARPATRSSSRIPRTPAGPRPAAAAVSDGRVLRHGGLPARRGRPRVPLRRDLPRGRRARFKDFWAFDAEGEQRAFEAFVDWVMARRREDPSMHVYHYAPYETSALKRLMGKYATREEEVDHLLRSQVFVDLYRVVNQGLRVGEPAYSLKNIEHLYMDREGEVATAMESVVYFERWFESGDPRGLGAVRAAEGHPGLQPGRLRLHVAARGVASRAAGGGGDRLPALGRRRRRAQGGVPRGRRARTPAPGRALARAAWRGWTRTGTLSHPGDAGPPPRVPSPGGQAGLVELLRAPRHDAGSARRRPHLHRTGHARREARGHPAVHGVPLPFRSEPGHEDPRGNTRLRGGRAPRQPAGRGAERRGRAHGRGGRQGARRLPRWRAAEGSLLPPARPRECRRSSWRASSASPRRGRMPAPSLPAFGTSCFGARRRYEAARKGRCSGRARTSSRGPPASSGPWRGRPSASRARPARARPTWARTSSRTS